MTCYIVDHRNNATDVKQSYVDVGCIPILDSSGRCSDMPVFDTSGPGDVVFLHSNESTLWVEHASKKSTTYFVFISTTGYPKISPLLTPPINVFLCEIPAIDFSKDVAFIKFIESVSSGLPNADLLRPNPLPEELVALYLLDVAQTLPNSEGSQDSAQLDRVRKSIIGDAEKQYLKLANVAKLPQEWNAVKDRRQLIAAVLNKVRQ